MELCIDDKGCFDLINNWSVAGRTRHVDSRKNFMWELKENNVVAPAWMPGEKLSASLLVALLRREPWKRT